MVETSFDESFDESINESFDKYQQVSININESIRKLLYKGRGRRGNLGFPAKLTRIYEYNLNVSCYNY